MAPPPAAALGPLLAGTALLLTLLLLPVSAADMCGTEPTVIHVAKGEKKHIKFWNTEEVPTTTPQPTDLTHTIEICTGHLSDGSGNSESSDGAGSPGCSHSPDRSGSSGSSGSSGGSGTSESSGSSDNPQKLSELTALSAISAIASEAATGLHKESGVEIDAEGAAKGTVETEGATEAGSETDGVTESAPGAEIEHVLTATPDNLAQKKEVSAEVVKPHTVSPEIPEATAPIIDRVVSHIVGKDTEEVVKAEVKVPEAASSVDLPAEGVATEAQKASPDEGSMFEGSGAQKQHPPSATIPLNKYHEIRIPLQDGVAPEISFEGSGDFVFLRDPESVGIELAGEHDRLLKVTGITDDMVTLEWTPDPEGSGELTLHVSPQLDVVTEEEEEGSGASEPIQASAQRVREKETPSVDAPGAEVLSDEPELEAREQDELLPLVQPQQSDTIFHLLSALPLGPPADHAAQTAVGATADQTVKTPNYSTDPSDEVPSEERLLLLQSVEGDRIILQHIPDGVEGSGEAAIAAEVVRQPAEEHEVEGSGQASQDAPLLEASGDSNLLDEHANSAVNVASEEAPGDGEPQKYSGNNPLISEKTWAEKEATIAGTSLHLPAHVESELQSGPVAVPLVRGTEQLAQVEMGVTAQELPIAITEGGEAFPEDEQEADAQAADLDIASGETKAEAVESSTNEGEIREPSADIYDDDSDELEDKEAEDTKDSGVITEPGDIEGSGDNDVAGKDEGAEIRDANVANREDADSEDAEEVDDKTSDETDTAMDAEVDADTVSAGAEVDDDDLPTSAEDDNDDDDNDVPASAEVDDDDLPASAEADDDDDDDAPASVEADDDDVPASAEADEDVLAGAEADNNGLPSTDTAAVDRQTLLSDVYRLISGDGGDSAQPWPPRRPAWIDFMPPMKRQSIRRPVPPPAEPTRRETLVVGQGPYLELYSTGGRDRPQQNYPSYDQLEPEPASEAEPEPYSEPEPEPYLEHEEEPELQEETESASASELVSESEPDLLTGPAPEPGVARGSPSKPEQQMLSFDPAESLRNTDDQLFRFIRSQPYPFVSALIHGTGSRGSRRATAAAAVDCEWQIKTEPHLYLLVTVNNLSAPYTVDCNGAYIEVERERDGFEARWCGNRIRQSGSRPHMVFARGEVRIAVFNDGNTTQLQTGFEADVEVVDLLDARQYATFRRSGLNFRQLVKDPVLPL